MLQALQFRRPEKVIARVTVAVHKLILLHQVVVHLQPVVEVQAPPLPAHLLILHHILHHHQVLRQVLRQVIVLEVAIEALVVQVQVEEEEDNFTCNLEI